MGLSQQDKLPQQPQMLELQLAQRQTPLQVEMSQQQQQQSPLVAQHRAHLAPQVEVSLRPGHPAPVVEVDASLQPKNPAPSVEAPQQHQLPEHTSSETTMCVRGTDTNRVADIEGVRGTDTSGRGADAECVRGTDTDCVAASVLSDFLEMSESRKTSRKRRADAEREEVEQTKIDDMQEQPKAKMSKPAGKRLVEKTKAVEPESQPKIKISHEASRCNYRVRNLSDPNVASVGIKYEPGNEKSREKAHLEAQKLVKAWGGK